MRIPLLLAAAAASAALAAAVPRRAAAGPAPAPRVVPIAAKRFAFLPAEIHLRKGEPVVLRLTTADVRHGLFSRKLGIDAEFEPGRPRDIAFTPAEAGTFALICDRFCGSGHGSMKITVIVE